MSDVIGRLGRRPSGWLHGTASRGWRGNCRAVQTCGRRWQPMNSRFVKCTDVVGGRCWRLAAPVLGRSAVSLVSQHVNVVADMIAPLCHHPRNYTGIPEKVNKVRITTFPGIPAAHLRSQMLGPAIWDATSDTRNRAAKSRVEVIIVRPHRRQGQ